MNNEYWRQWQQDWQSCNKKWNKCNWSNWLTFKLEQDSAGKVVIPNSYQDLTDLKKQLSVFGVYMIFCNNYEQQDNGIYLQMLKAIDKYGVLTIGESQNLYTRINNFIKCAKDLNNDNGGHSAGNTFYDLGLSDKLKLEHLWVSFLPVCAIDNNFLNKETLDKAQKEKAKKLLQILEYELTLSYLLYHGELPILTAKLQKPVFKDDDNKINKQEFFDYHQIEVIKNSKHLKTNNS